MASWGNILLGALGLAVLDGVLSSEQATSNVGGFVADAGKAVDWVVSPSVPAFGAATTAKGSGPSLAVYQQSAPPSSSSSAPALSPSGTATFPESPQTAAQGGAV